MSARALNWAWAAEPRTATQKLVLAALADRADDEGYCWPSIRWITAKCAPAAERTVRRSLVDLEDQGFVRKVYRRRNEDGSLGTWLLQLAIPSGHERPLDYWPPTATGLVATGGQSESLPEDLEPTSNNLPDGRLREEPKTANGTRPRDPIWDALVAVFGEAPRGMERGRWNAAAKSLRADGATAAQVQLAADAYGRVFGDVAMTPTALASNWTTLTRARDGPRQRITGWRFVRGTHGSSYVPDPQGTDVPPRGYA